jgi:remodeling and spacing factor 1
MASDNEASCESDPNFAVICAFMEKFGVTCGLASIDFLELQEMLENTQEVPQELIDLHIKLLRKSRKTVSNERWEKAIIKFCHGFCVQDAWEIERFGYKKARLSSKLRVLKELLEMQFDYNARFKAEINKMSAEELRSQPLGKDKQGHAYWFQNDNNCQIRVYKEDPDEETWILVAKDREGLVSLIHELSNGDSKVSSESAINEDDSNSLVEKPIIDTGQVDSSSSDSNKKMSGDSENSSESKESSKKEENISPQEDARFDQNEEQGEEDEERKESKIEDESETTTCKRPREDEEEEEVVKKTRLEVGNEVVGEPVEEPVMLVKGEGTGAENECVNPIVGEEIEEEVLFFCGAGEGVDCQTGNEDKAADSQPTQSESGDCSGKSTGRDTSDSDYVSISDSKNCVNSSGSSEEVPTSPVKNPYKLGTIIDTKTDNKFFSTVRSPTKKSRWDVETIIAKDTVTTGHVKELVDKWEQINDEEKDAEPATTPPPKKSMFFFGPGCLQFTPATVGFGTKVPQEKTEDLEVLPSNVKGDIGYRIGDGGEDNKVETSDCVQSGENAGPLDNEVDHQTPIEARIGDKLEDDVFLPASDNREATEKTKVEDVSVVQDATGNSTSVDQDEQDQVEAELQEQLVPESDFRDDTIKVNNALEIPSVTAALVECEETEDTNKENLMPVECEASVSATNANEDNSTPSNHDEIIEPVPVIEEICVKKYSYLVGEETKKSIEEANSNKSENQVAENHHREDGHCVHGAAEAKKEVAIADVKDDSLKAEEREDAIDLKNDRVGNVEEKEAVVAIDEKKDCHDVEHVIDDGTVSDYSRLPKSEDMKSELRSEDVKVLVGKNLEPAVESKNENVDDKIEQDNQPPVVIESKENLADSKHESVVETGDSQPQIVDEIEGERNSDELKNENVSIDDGQIVKIDEMKSENSENLENEDVAEAENDEPPHLEKIKETEVDSKVEDDVDTENREAPNIDKFEDEKNVNLKVEETEAKDTSIIKDDVTNVSHHNEVKQDEIITKEAIVVLKESDKIEDKKICEKEETTNNTINKSNRGRKNNSDQVAADKPRIFTRRTRASKLEEPEEKPEELMLLQPPRRGRSRVMQKTEKEESPEGDSSKKMKMSNEEVQEEDGAKKPTRSKKETNEIEEVNKQETTDASPVSVTSPNAAETVLVESSSSSDIVELPDNDPLAESEEEAKQKENPMSLSSFSLDFNESPTPTPPLTRSGLRKRGHESPPNSEEVEETAGKRQKMKTKRAVDVKLRKSIEEQKKQELISSDDDNKNEQTEDKSGKKKYKKVDQAKNEEAVVVSSDAEREAEEASQKKKKLNKNKRLLSSLGIDPDKPLGFAEETTIGVRQSRRIAQLKIKEEAERRKLEEEIVQDTHKKKKSKKSEDKDYKVDKKKLKNDVDDDDAGEDDSADSKKRKKKKKKHRKLFDEFNPWRSSSDSSSTDEEEEEEIAEESDDEVLQYVSDHEFSPESDMEADGEALPLKRARTARKESDVEEVDDCPCQKCGKSDHPEWILLCDRCDNGWHCSCLRPPLLVIPEGDWFCPPCQHSTLLKKLQEKLKEYDKKLSKKEIEDRRKQRLAYVGISLNSVLPTKETENIKKRRLGTKQEDDDEEVDDEETSSEESESGSGSGSGSESGSESDEPIYQLRQRRQAHSYRFNDYDDLINSAIQDEMEAVKGAGNQGRGKDIATIVNAEKEEERKKESEVAVAEECEEEPLPPVVPVQEKDKEAKPLYSDDEPVQGIRKKIIGRKKHRKLNSLDISSADDSDSDEDFKGTSSESDDDFEEDLGSEDSEVLESGRGRRKGNDPVRRSTRARTSRYDADFIDDGDSEDEDDAPRRKKKRSIWDESESEESDRSWGRRRRKPASRQKKAAATTTKKKKTKKKKKNDDSDAEVYKKKKPKIKFGLDGEDEGPGRRTRGKKINYVDALGSDSDEDRVKRPPPRIESEEEYVANEDEEIDEDDKITDEEEADSGEENVNPKPPKVHIQSYTDARFTQLLPEGIPSSRSQLMREEDGEDEPNPIDQINRNVEMMDENEMEKMMEEEEYANKQLQLVALQLEKEKRRKEREAKKLEGVLPMQMPQQQDLKKRPKKKEHFQFSGPMQEPLVGNVDNLIINSENNDELSEPPGVSLPMFAELGTAGEGLDDPQKKRRARNKKSLEEAVANLGSVRQQESTAFMAMAAANKTLPTDLSGQESNIEIAAPPQPFSQSQPTPSVITRMLQSKPGQPGYPIGTIRPKQFAAMADRDEEVHHAMSPSPAHIGQYIQGATIRPQVSSPYRQLPPNMNHYPRSAAAPPQPHQIRNPSPLMYHSHRPMDPSPSGGGTISIADHNSPARVVSPASSSPGSNKNETPPPPYTRPPPVQRFPMISTTSAGPRHIHMVAPPHLQPPRPNLSPYHPSMPPAYHYGQFGQPEEALPPTVYQNSPYSEQFANEGQVNPSENSNSKSFDEESGGEFGGLVSYFSSQREDDLES